MSTNTLNTTYANGETIDASHINEVTLAMLGDMVGRNTNGIPTTGQNLGTLALPWGNIYGSGLILDGEAVDTSLIVSSPNRIVSGKTRSLSSMPDFIRANGAALSFQVLGASTNLILSVNNSAATVTTDITKTGVTQAPATNNTCAVNDSTMTSDKFAGEDDTSIIIDTVGSEISSKVGQIIALKKTTEIMLAYVKSATELTNVFRGFFFDSSGNPIVREGLSNDDTLTLMSLGWVFMEDNGVTVDVSYKTPVYSYTAPSSPTTGDYWYDLSASVWKRYSGVSFEVINRTLIGVVVADDTNCIASRCFDFSKQFKATNTTKLEIFSTEIIRSKELAGVVSVYGTDIARLSSKLSWNITTDLESGLTEESSTVYYLYLTDQGQRIVSKEKPYYRPDLQGDYHPYHSWRLMGMAYNDASSNLITIWDENTPIFVEAATPIGTGSFTTSSTSFVDVTDQFVNVLLRKPKKILFELLRNSQITALGYYSGFFGSNAATNNQSEYALSINGASETHGTYLYEATSGGIAVAQGLSHVRPVASLKTGFHKVQLRAKRVGSTFHEVAVCRFTAKEA